MGLQPDTSLSHIRRFALCVCHLCIYTALVSLPVRLLMFRRSLLRAELRRRAVHPPSQLANLLVQSRYVSFVLGDDHDVLLCPPSLSLLA